MYYRRAPQSRHEDETMETQRGEITLRVYILKHRQGVLLQGHWATSSLSSAFLILAATQGTPPHPPHYYAIVMSVPPSPVVSCVMCHMRCLVLTCAAVREGESCWLSYSQPSVVSLATPLQFPFHLPFLAPVKTLHLIYRLIRYLLPVLSDLSRSWVDLHL